MNIVSRFNMCALACYLFSACSQSCSCCTKLTCWRKFHSVWFKASTWAGSTVFVNTCLKADFQWNQQCWGPTKICPLPSALAPPSHRCSKNPRQGCTSLGSTERLLCFGSWSPDALIETPCPCRNQREGTRAYTGGDCEHIWHLQEPAHKHSKHREINVQSMLLLTNVRLLAVQAEKSNYIKSRRKHSHSPAAKIAPLWAIVLFIQSPKQCHVGVWSYKSCCSLASEA